MVKKSTLFIFFFEGFPKEQKAAENQAKIGQEMREFIFDSDRILLQSENPFHYIYQKLGKPPKKDK